MSLIRKIEYVYIKQPRAYGVAIGEKPIDKLHRTEQQWALAQMSVKKTYAAMQRSLEQVRAANTTQCLLRGHG